MKKFKLINYKGKEKEPLIEKNFLKNAKHEDKIMYNCSVCGKKSSRTISSLYKRGVDYKNIDLTTPELFMCRRHSQEYLTEQRFGFKNQFQRKEVIESIQNKRIEKKKKSGDVFYYLDKKDYISSFCGVCKKKFTIQKRSYDENICPSCKIKKSVTKKGLNSIKIALEENDLEFLDVENYIGQRVDDKDIVYKFKCLKCQTVFEGHLHSNIPKCPKCFPKYRSKPEIEIENFIKELGFKVISSSRKIIPPYEIDIFIPEKNIAIELNGLYWHSEVYGGKSKDYHLDKTIECKEKKIELIHIFEDEWKIKKEIVKSIIKNKIGIIDEKKYARKCEIKELKSKDLEVFYNNNHIQGAVNSSVNLGLFYEGEIVSALSFSKSRFEKNTVEITRFANKLNISVIGGFSKMIKHFIKNNNFNKISTYSDRRYFNGNVYLNNGFTFVGYTQPNYYYIDNNYIFRYNRIRFQKHKLENLLENFDSKLTEWENMKLNKYDRIWDCGNYKFELKGEYNGNKQ